MPLGRQGQKRLNRRLPAYKEPRKGRNMRRGKENNFSGPIRVKLPRKDEQLGRITELLGASRFKVECKDGVERICRIPGKMRKRLRVSLDDWVIVRPWSIEPESKGDIVWIYTRTQVGWLKRKGYI